MLTICFPKTFNSFSCIQQCFPQRRFENFIKKWTAWSRGNQSVTFPRFITERQHKARVDRRCACLKHFWVSPSPPPNVSLSRQKLISTSARGAVSGCCSGERQVSGFWTTASRMTFPRPAVIFIPEPNAFLGMGFREGFGHNFGRVRELWRMLS